MLGGRIDEAVAELRESVRLEPGNPESQCNLGHALKAAGRFEEALEHFLIGHAAGSRRADWEYPSSEWVTEAKRLARLASRLPAILKGNNAPDDNAERLILAQMCYDTKHHAAAARLWAEGLVADPKLGDDR
jgi:thioredoxin-like negative regulator of GroEL